MTFHEKSAWVMAILLIVIGSWYTHTVWQMSLAIGETAPPLLPLIAVATAALIAGAIVGHIIVAISNPDEAEGETDERDKKVLTRAGNISGYVLGFGCFAALWHYFWDADGNLMFHIIVGSLLIAQIAEYVLTIYFYRRGH